MNTPLFTGLVYTLAALLSTVRCAELSACTGVPDGHFVRNATSCQAYHYCDRGQTGPADQCPSAFVFDAGREVCDRPERVDCSQCSPFGIHNLADPQDCRRYFACVAGERTHRMCADGLAFDERLADCNVAGRVRCNGQQAANIGDGSAALRTLCAPFRHMRSVHIGQPADCTRFVTCLAGRAFERRCPIDLYFNAYTGRCALPGAVPFCQTFGPAFQQIAGDAADNWSMYPAPGNSWPPPQQQPPNPPPSNQMPGNSWPSQQPQPQNPAQPPQNQIPGNSWPSQQPQPQNPAQPPQNQIPGNSWQPQQPQSPTGPNSSLPPVPNQPVNPPQQPPSQPQAVPKPNAGSTNADPVRCPKKNGYNVAAGTACQKYVYCIKSVVRFDMSCSDGRWFDKMTEKCESQRPSDC